MRECTKPIPEHGGGYRNVRALVAVTRLATCSLRRGPHLVRISRGPHRVLGRLREAAVRADDGPRDASRVGELAEQPGYAHFSQKRRDGCTSRFPMRAC